MAGALKGTPGGEEEVQKETVSIGTKGQRSASSSKLPSGPGDAYK